MDYNGIMRLRNEAYKFNKLFRINTEEVREGYARGRMHVQPECINPIGSVHGGCMFTLADTVGGTAAISHGYYVTTISGNINYLRPAMNTEYLVAEANEVKYGKNIMVYQVNIFDDKEAMVATGTFSYFNLNKKVELE